jgi:phenylalanyl-tRNA synthetase beta chain
MPTIAVNIKDLETLMGAPLRGQPLTIQQLESWLPLAKGEVKDFDRDSGEVKIELQDSNRPDLWCCEGIARQIRIKLDGGPAAREYQFFRGSKPVKRQLHVAGGLDKVRPYIAACTAVGYQVTDAGLAQLIQTQEKLADIFGRKRATVSIGLYRLKTIVFPVRYLLVKPDEVKFRPLGFDDMMSPREIFAVHPKGLAFGSILAGHDRVPLLVDEEGQVLSMPPIINSRDIGELHAGDEDIFVEVTGTDLPMVLLTLNILAVNLADRGAAIEAVAVHYPYKTEMGAIVRTPTDIGHTRDIPLASIEQALGQRLDAAHIREALQAYGHEVTVSHEKAHVKPPPYRNDVMHAVDVAEDVAISIGYDRFEPVMPTQFTVGSLSAIEHASDRLRDLMVGQGFQEIVSNILASRQELIDRMRLSHQSGSLLVEVDNPMTQSGTCLRQWMLPSLLRVEAASSRAFYPHRLFEVGEAAVRDSSDAHGSRTDVVLGAMIAHASANFSEIHSCLDLLLYYADRPYALEPIVHPSFMEGRAGRIVCQGRSVGLIGEVHPEVLEQWQITMPVAAFELNVDALTEGRETAHG